MKKILFLTITMFLFFACGSGESSGETENPDLVKKSVPADEGKGVGEITHVELNSPLKAAMVEDGKAIYELKCAACHKLTDQRVVGPGWAGVTTKRKPEWIMNMITNVEVMLEEDPAAREMLKECLVRMPNQNLSTDDAREVLEFMYANDGQAVGE